MNLNTFFCPPVNHVLMCIFFFYLFSLLNNLEDFSEFFEANYS